jgi:hypothetical protein
MSAPSISAIYPNDEATGVPVGATIQITFDQGVDLQSVKDCVVAYGPDYDQTSGPDSATWIDSDTGSNPFFLNSPGFTGTVECSFDFVYVDVTGAEIDPSPEYTSSTDEGVSRHKLLLRPKSLLKPDTEYNVYLIGDSSDGTSRGISHRTVWDPDYTAVVSTTGLLHTYGSYEGTSDDQYNIKITQAGDIGTAQYKYWPASDIEANAVTGRVTSRRFRRLDADSGVQVRFSGSGFAVDDIYTVNVRAKALMSTSYSFSFTAGSAAITSVPETASTSIIGTETSLTSDATALTVIEMLPSDGATHQSFKNRTITVTFSEELDVSTVTDATVTVLAYPISGNFDTALSNAGEPVELAKKLTVSDDILTIEL